MKKIMIPVAIAAILLTSCSTSKKSTAHSGTEQTTSASSSKNTEDGLSFETAVIMHEKNEGDGVAAEYKWIKNHYSNYTIGGQSLASHDKKSYDIINITLSDGKNVKLYFDISNFFGKF
jgi:major membrane immunogen (membrane-anchored lipoprotein)